jgi:hypothetical protein
MEDCKDTLTFDTLTTKNDFMSQLSILSLVTADNYEEAKQKWSATVPGYFDGDYDSFLRKKSHLSDMFSLSNIEVSHQEYFQHTLSRDARANYAACIAGKDNLPIAAWVDSFDKTTIVVKVANRMVDTTIDIKVVGNPQPSEPPSRLGTNADQALEFPWDPKEGATITFNVKNAVSGNQLRSTTVAVPPLRKVEQRKENKTLTTTVDLGAGADGSTAGRQIKVGRPFVAPPGFSILAETVTEVSHTGFGLIRTNVTWAPEVVDGRVARLNCVIGDSEADNGDTQRPMTFTYSVESVRNYLVEVDA